MKHKINCRIVSASRSWGHDVVVEARAEDGRLLATHVSSCIDWAKHDIGLTSDWKHDIYRSEFPEGYELIWKESDPCPPQS